MRLSTCTQSSSISDMEPISDKQNIPGERIQRNLAKVRARMAEAAASASRPVEPIRLVAVTKTVGLAEIQKLLELGVSDLGESRVQDAERKIRAYAAPGPEGDRHPIPTGVGIGVSTPPPSGVSPQPRWHLIGHLQTNKADKAAKLFHTVHAVDSLRVAQALNKERLGCRGTDSQSPNCRKLVSVPLLPPLPCLLEVNVSGEAQKFGLRPDVSAVGEILRSCAELPGLQILGLMCMAPYSEHPEATSRPVFRRLRELLAEANTKGFCPSPLAELSMGMTQDYAIAIEEGATMVRVGTALFE